MEHSEHSIWVNRCAYHLAKISENSGWNVNDQVIFRKFVRKFWTAFRGIHLFLIGTNRLKITLPFDRFSRFQSSAKGKWREIHAHRLRLPVW